MKAYKVLTKLDGKERYFSYMLPEDLKLEYKPNKKVRGIGNTPLFVFKTLRDAIDFSEDFPDENAVIWECEIEKYSGKRPRKFLIVGNGKVTKKDIEEFWASHKRHELCLVPRGTLLANWVKLIRRIEE